MEITREALEEHKAQLESERLQHLNMAHAVDGAIQDCEFWLAELDKEADAKPEIKVSK
jgi:hypothetical protein